MNKRAQTYVIGLVIMELLFGGLYFVSGLKYLENLKADTRIEQKRTAEDISAMAEVINGVQGNVVASTGLSSLPIEKFTMRVSKGAVGISTQGSIYGQNTQLQEESIETTGEPHFWFSKTGKNIESGPFSAIEQRKNLLPCPEMKKQPIGIDAVDEESRVLAHAVKTFIPDARTGTADILRDPVAPAEERQARLQGTFVLGFVTAKDNSLTIFIPGTDNYGEACKVRNALIETGLFEDAAIVPRNEKIVHENGILIRIRPNEQSPKIAEAIHNALS